MMKTLLESGPEKKRAAGGTISSVIFHTSIVLLAVFATARAGVPKDAGQRVEKLNFINTAPPKPVAPPHAAPTEIAPPKGFKILIPPVMIATRIPDLNLGAKLTDPGEFDTKGAKPGSSTGSEGSNGTKEGGAPGIDTNKPYSDFEVERVVSAISGTSVSYPEGMRSSGVQGKVEVQFVVNGNGRVETGTIRVLSSTNQIFTQAVRDALSRMRFRPAQIGNTNVSQVVQQAFLFKLDQ